jgi:hypothetical protein
MRLSQVLIMLAFVGACSTQQTIHTVSTDSESNRQIASAGTGINYPAGASFRLSDIKGQTYITFLKNKLKPALDKYSDKKNGGGGGFENIGSANFRKGSEQLQAKTFSKYKGAKWNRNSRKYEGGLSDAQVELAYDTLKKIRPVSTTDSIQYFVREDKAWPTKNDMAVALKEAKINAAPFDLATLYCLTGGIGVKVKLDDNNYNYHVLYKTGKTDPHQEVMSGRSFSSSPGRGVADATDPEYLRDLNEYLSETRDQKPFYRTLIMSLASSDMSGLSQLSNLGQAVLADFYTVYTAEAVRHLMVDLQSGMHPWEIDLAAVTAVSSLSVKTGKIVTGGQLVDGDIGGWFAPSPNNKPDGPQRSGIGITRRDRKKLQAAIHKFEMGNKDGRELITKIQAIIGDKYSKNDVIQGVFEFLSNKYTPASMGANAAKLADLFAEFMEVAHGDAEEIHKLVQ